MKMDERRFSETWPVSTSAAHRAFDTKVNLRQNNRYAAIKNPIGQVAHHALPAEFKNLS